MSSLRISHQSRAIGAAATGGDTGRSEHADHADGAGFALALGAAAGVAPKDAAALLGGKAGDGSDGAPAPRKRADNSGKPGDAATAAASIGATLVGTAAAVETGAMSATAGSSDDLPTVTATSTGDRGATPHSMVGRLTTATQTAAGRGLVVAATGLSSAEITPAANGIAATISPGVQKATTSGGAAPRPASFIDPASSPAVPAAPAGNQEPLDPGQQPAGGSANLVTAGSMVSQIVGSTQSAAPAIPLAGDASGAASPAAVGPAADASAAITGQPVALLSGPNPGAGHAAAAVAPSIPSVLAAMSGGHPATTDGGGAFGSAPRDRFAPPTATQAADDASAAAVTAAAGNTPTPTVPTAMPMPGSGPDSGGSGAVADQVAGQLARMVSNGTQEMVMRLHPPELGDLTVRVAVNGRDVSAWFASPQPQVQHAISAAIGQLQTNLGSAGYNLNGAWVGGNASDGRQQQATLPQASPAINAPLAAAATLPAAASTRPASSGLNIYV